MRKQAKRPKTNAVARGRALEALYEMRARGMSLREAARVSHTTPTTVQKYLPRALKRAKGGKFVATKFDRYVRKMNFLTADGIVEISVRDSRAASKLAQYAAAVSGNLTTGKTDPLKPFKNQFITVGKVKYKFITDAKTLTLLAERGVVQFEELYADFT